MNVAEILTIYLTIGAPFGVQYFLQHRRRTFEFFTGIKTVGIIFFWIFYALWLLRKNISFVQIKLFAAKPFGIDKKIKIVCASLEADFLVIKEQAETIAFFDFRELLERYVGLTLAIEQNAPDKSVYPHEIEIFRFAARQEKSNRQLSARVLHRTNFRRLQVHQIKAQQNLLQIVNELIGQLKSDENSEAAIFLKVQQFAQDFKVLADLLRDSEFETGLDKIIKRLSDQSVLVKKTVQVEINKWILPQPMTTAVLPATSPTLKTTRSQDSAISHVKTK